MSAYWVYESYPHNKAVVHKGDCLYCRGGTHRQGTNSKRDGSWLGPYATHKTAAMTAVGTRRKIQSSCKHCIDALEQSKNRETSNDVGI